MTSQKSQNKLTLLTLMREDLKHRKWMFVLSAFVQLMFGPIAVLFAFSDVEYNYYYSTGDPQDLYKAMKYAVERVTDNYLPVIMMVIAVVGALIVGVGGYRHLFNRRMTDMVNSLPVTRGKQFDSIYYNNWLIWLIPQLVSLIITTIIMLAKAASYGFAPLILRSALLVLLGSVLCFGCMMHLVILAVVLSGSVFNAFLNIAFIGFDLIVTYVLFEVLCQSCFDTFMDLPLFVSDVCWLSAPISGAYLGALIGTGFFLKDSTEIIRVFGSESVAYLVLFATVVVAIMNLIIAYSIYIKRKSEDSESGVSNKAYALCIRCVNSVLGGLFAAVVIFELFYMNERATSIWQIFFAAVFSAVVFGVIDMIHGRSFKGFFVHWKQMVAVVLVTEAVLMTFIFDLTGFDKRVIPENSIERAMIQMYSYGMGSDGSGYSKNPNQEGMLIETARLYGFDRKSYYMEIPADLAYKVVTAKKVFWKDDIGSIIYDPLTGRTERISEADIMFAVPYVNFIAERKSGLDFMREYPIYDRELIEEIMNVPGYMEQEFPLRSGELGYPKRIWVSDGHGYQRTAEIPPELMHQLFDASVEDFKDNYSFDYVEMWDRSYVYCLQCEYYVTTPDSEDGSYWINTMYIYLGEEDVRTIELLEEMGLEEYRYDPDDYSAYSDGYDEEIVYY